MLEVNKLFFFLFILLYFAFTLFYLIFGTHRISSYYKYFSIFNHRLNCILK